MFCRKLAAAIIIPLSLFQAGKNCEVCENPCSKPRPEGCSHKCPKQCHPGSCPLCKQILRIKCHCGLNLPYVTCSDWLILEKREDIQSCGNQCPKNFDCGHKCRANCHSGPCPNPELCKRKVKFTCKCKRIKRDFPCDAVRNKLAKVECDDNCFQKKEEERKQQELINAEKKREEELKNEKELAKYNRLFEGKKKNRDRRQHEEEQETTFLQKYWVLISSCSLFLLATVFFYLFSGM